MSLHRALVLAVLCGCCSALAGSTRLLAAGGGENGTPPPPSRRTAVVAVVERNRPAVVNILSERGGDRGSGGSASQSRANGMGTGILIDARGYIVTNYHVVEDVSVLRVRLSDGSSYSAQIMARDRDADLALIKIDAGKPLPTVTFGTANDLMVGETVIAIGNAFGYENTVSMGIVSALKRDVTLNKEISYKSLIQTNATINPGNSGGPLLNIDGELVGVNVAIRAGAQGISFAIPVDNMMNTVSDMLAQRRRGELPTGITYRDQIDLGKNPPRSLVVEKVSPNSAAAKAGLLPGDMILQAGDFAVASGIDFERALLDCKPGNELALRLRRGGAEVKAELHFVAGKTVAAVPEQAWKTLGLRLSLTDNEAVTRSQSHLHGGLLVTEVRKDSPAARAGVQPGDTLVGLHVWETINFDNVAFVLNHEDFANFQPLKFHLLRNGHMHSGTLPQ